MCVCVCVCVCVFCSLLVVCFCCLGFIVGFFCRGWVFLFVVGCLFLFGVCVCVCPRFFCCSPICEGKNPQQKHDIVECLPTTFNTLKTNHITSPGKSLCHSSVVVDDGYQ